MAIVPANYVVKSEDASTNLTKLLQSVIYDDGTNIGIGITNPGTKLVVNGAIRGGLFPNNTTNSGEAWVGRASDRTLGTYTIQLGGSSATGTTWEIVDRAWTKVIASISGEAPASSFRVTNTGVVYMNGGSVGIGTTNPSTKLTVTTATQGDGLTVINSLRQITTFQSTGEHCFIYFNSHHDNTYFPVLHLQRSSVTYGTVGLNRASNSDALGSYVESEMVVGSSTNTPMSLQTNGVRRMVISGSNVLIGARSGASPTDSGLLQVQESMAVRANTSGFSWVNFFTGTGGTNYWHLSGRNSIQSEALSLYRYSGSYSTEIITFSTGSNVGVGTASPSYKLHVNGTMYSAGSSVIYKENIESYDTTTDKIMALNPVTYDYKIEYTHLGKTLQSNYQIGLIAEEVAKIFPELAVLTEEEGQQVVRNVDYEKLSVILLTEVQKLRKEINELKR